MSDLEVMQLLDQAFNRIDRLEEIIGELCPHTDLDSVGNMDVCSLCGKQVNYNEPDEPELSYERFNPYR